MNDVANITWEDQEPEPSHELNGQAALDPVLMHWARFRDQFAALMVDGFWTLEDLETKVAAKQAFFFPGRNCACVGEIQIFPGGNRVMSITYAVGDPQELLSMEPGVVALCRMMGCTHMVMDGRPAWAKLLKPLGYSTWTITSYKAI